MSERTEVHPPIRNAAGPSAAASASTKCPFHLTGLDPALILAAERGLAIAPALTHSSHASPRAFSGELSSEIDVIAQASAYYPRCNWTAHLGASDLVAIEVDMRIGYKDLAMLCRRNFWALARTLQFADDTLRLRFFMFRSTGTPVRFLGRQFPGVRIHSGSAFLFVPPSWFVSGRLIWLNQAPILDVPDWALEPASRLRRRWRIIPPDADPAPWQETSTADSAWRARRAPPTLEHRPEKAGALNF